MIRDLTGSEIGRGFAESTNWARTTDTVLAPAGLPANSQTRAPLSPVAPSWWLRLLSLIEVTFNTAELQKILQEAKGL